MKELWEIAKLLFGIGSALASLGFLILAIHAGNQKNYAEGTFYLGLGIYCWLLSRKE